jgi:cytochrome c biogenesis protein CcmG, thiol:disulfide interchange protein DsbE
MRVFFVVRFLAVTVLACAATLAGCGGAEPKSASPGPIATKRALAGAPAPLAALHRQGGELLGGGADAFKGRLKQLHGYPVVVNKWASWCPPCRGEFPFFQRQALKRGRKIAFVGVDSNDNDSDAASFLKRFPVPYPSYKDPDLKVAAVFNGTAAFPTTAFYDSKGGLAFVHQGAYASEAKLEQDVERYAK